MALQSHSPFGRGYRPRFPRNDIHPRPNPSKIKAVATGHNTAGRPVGHRRKFNHPIFVESQMHFAQAPAHQVAGVGHHVRGVLRRG